MRELQTLMERLELFAEGPTVSAAAVLAQLPCALTPLDGETLRAALEAHDCAVNQQGASGRDR